MTSTVHRGTQPAGWTVASSPPGSWLQYSQPWHHPLAYFRHSFRSRGQSPARRSRLGQAGLGTQLLTLPAAPPASSPSAHIQFPVGFERGAPILPSPPKQALPCTLSF